VQAGNVRAWDEGPSGTKTCRTAPGGQLDVSCATTSTTFLWKWNQVPGATQYRVRSDLSHPWFTQTRLAEAIEGAEPNEEVVLYVQAGNEDGWNVEGTAVSSCRTRP